MSDDEIIGIKSTSIKFKNNIKSFVTTSGLLFLSMIIYLFINDIGKNFYFFYYF